MSWRSVMYNLMYRFGAPRWDTNITPPEVVAVIEGDAAIPAGRALDLGCGTGTNIIYLARHGWEAVGVDFSPIAIQQARQKARGARGATFVEGDVSRLAQLDIEGPFDFVLDIGCFHGLPAHARQSYVQEVARVIRPGGLFMIWAIASDRRPFLPGVPITQDKEIAERFGRDFTLERVQQGEGRWTANWYTLRRREEDSQIRRAGTSGIL
jgi:SAM-dependent methyltransferase